MSHELAEGNISLLKPDSDPGLVVEFQAVINPLLDAAGARRGFRGILEETGDIGLSEIIENRQYAFNVTIWDSMKACLDFLRPKEHRQILQKYKNLYEKPDEPSLAFWWVEAGNTPSVQEAAERIQSLRTRGPTDYAFDFKSAADFNP